MPNQNDTETISQLQLRIQQLEEENRTLLKKQFEVNAAKELYLQIFEHFPALIWRANTQKLCDYFNSTWLNFTGRTLLQEYGNGWADGVHPEDLDACLKIFVQNFDRREPFSMEYRLLNYKGEYRWIIDHGRPYYDFDQTFLGYIGACYDITDARNNERRLEELSITDALTQVHNRYKLDSVLNNEVVRARRYLSPLSLIILDIDHFKQTNDNYGHQTGDRVLKELSTLLKNNVRECDIVGRWGGEEFMIICPDTDVSGASAIATKLRLAIQNYSFKSIPSQTATFGVTQFYQGDSIDQFIKRADTALYRGKNSSKNSVFVEEKN